MRKDLYQEMYELEDTYWWHVAKRYLVKELLNMAKLNSQQSIFLDIGCGTGKFLEEMNQWKQWQELVGLDGAVEALRFTRKRGIASVKKADFERKLPLHNKSVDVITSLDVVEHVEHDQLLVKEFYRVLKPGGVVVITVPAHQWLWTYWDDILGHKRRHTRASVLALAKQAGFEPVKLSYFYSYLLPLAVLFRLLKTLLSKGKPSSDFIRLPQPINQILVLCAKIETKLIAHFNIPFGLSVVCLLRKKS